MVKITVSRKPFNAGARVTLKDSDGHYKAFYINYTAGFGGSSIVYDASTTDSDGIKHRYKIKEFYPAGLGIERDDKGNLVIPKESSIEFEQRKTIFMDSVKLLAELRDDDNFTNKLCTIISMLSGYGTIFVAMDISAGEVYSIIRNKSLKEHIEICLAVAKTMKLYHDKGFLYLDLKPENIFVLKETNELIKLFDLDSTVRIEDIKNKDIKFSSTPCWAAPELEQSNTKKICIQTDFYSVGAMLFSRIMDRMPNAMDGCSFTKWEYDESNLFFKNVDPRVEKLLTAFFKKTIATSVKKRYQTDDELINALEELKTAADPQKRFLYSSLNFNKTFFVGREKELEAIHNTLKENNVVFLSGIGGIGKSELAKRYGQMYRDEYDAVVFGIYSSNLMSFITDDRYIHINNYSRFYDEPEKDYFDRKYRVLKEIVNEKALFIIDNFNVDTDEYLNELISLGCKVIFTTRNRFDDLGYTQIDVGVLASDKEAEELFGYYYAISDEEKDSVSVISVLEILLKITDEQIAKIDDYNTKFLKITYNIV